MLEATALYTDVLVSGFGRVDHHGPSYGIRSVDGVGGRCTVISIMGWLRARDYMLL